MALVERVFENRMPSNNLILYADVPLGVFEKSMGLNHSKVSAMLEYLNAKQGAESAPV